MLHSYNKIAWRKEKVKIIRESTFTVLYGYLFKKFLQEGLGRGGGGGAGSGVMMFHSLVVSAQRWQRLGGPWVLTVVAWRFSTTDPPAWRYAAGCNHQQLRGGGSALGQEGLRAARRTFWACSCASAQPPACQPWALKPTTLLAQWATCSPVWYQGFPGAADGWLPAGLPSLRSQRAASVTSAPVTFDSPVETGLGSCK